MLFGVCVHVCAYLPGVELKVEAEGEREKIHRTGSPNISTANRLSPNSVNLPYMSIRYGIIILRNAFYAGNKINGRKKREGKRIDK